MKTVKIVSYFEATPSWGITSKIAGKLVSLWTRSKFFHSEIVMGEERFTAHTTKGVIIEEKPLRDNVTEYAEVIEIRVSDEEYSKGREFLLQQLGKPYDWKGIFLSQFIPSHKENPEAYFCSELCAESLKTMGSTSLPKESSEYNPGNLMEALQI